MEKLLQVLAAVIVVFYMVNCTTDEITPYDPPPHPDRGIDRTGLEGVFNLNDACINGVYKIEITRNGLSSDGLLLRYLYNGRTDSLRVDERLPGDDTFDRHTIRLQEVAIDAREAHIGGEIINYYDSIMVTYSITYSDLGLRVQCQGIGKKVEQKD